MPYAVQYYLSSFVPVQPNVSVSIPLQLIRIVVTLHCVSFFSMVVQKTVILPRWIKTSRVSCVYGKSLIGWLKILPT